MAGAKRVELQWLRALAATEVVVCHSDLAVKHFSDFELPKAWWYAPFTGIGVELFFILSGYVICMRIASYGTSGAFITSRIRRLFPMYAVFTSLVLFTLFVNPSWRLNNFELTFSTVVNSYLILPQWPVPILGVGWTLEHEMVFYWTVAAVMLGWTMTGVSRLAVGWLLVAMGVIGCLQGPPPGWGLWLHHIFSPYMFAFAFGWILCCEEKSAPAMRWANLALFAAVMAFAWSVGEGYGDRLVWRIALMALLFLAFVACSSLFNPDHWLNRVGVLLGDASYSIYLCHWFVLSVVGKVLGVLQPPASLAEVIRLASVAASIAVGVALYKFLERPIDLWLRGEISLADLPRLSFKKA